MKIGNVMSRDVQLVKPEDTIRSAAATFLSSSPSLSGRVGVKRFQTAPSI
jgi:hypothetical protein